MADFNWYRNFLAVYRAGSVSGAARQRNLTQPAVSQQLAALEASVGEALFVRTPRGMRPTERGNALYTQTVESLDRLERISRGLKRDAAPTAFGDESRVLPARYSAAHRWQRHALTSSLWGF